MINKIDLQTCVIMELARQPTNVLSYDFLKLLYRELLRTEKDNQKICIILQSKEDTYFSSGLDLGNLPAGKYQQKKQIFKLVYMMHKIVRLITGSRKIYISSLTGAVIGSAVSLALACDFCFAAPDVWFWLPDPLYGGLLADGGIELIRKYAGISGARKLCLTNQRVSVKEAKEMGLVSRIVEKRNLCSEVQSFALKLSQYSFTTLQETKSILNKGICRSFPVVRLLKVIRSREMEERINQVLKHRNGGSNESGK